MKERASIEPAPSVNASPDPDSSPRAALKELAGLFEEGLIDEGEYKAKKSEILSRMCEEFARRPSVRTLVRLSTWATCQGLSLIHI